MKRTCETSFNMENGMDILNKMKEIQNRSIALKKVSKESEKNFMLITICRLVDYINFILLSLVVCDETITKLKELRQYNEENISNKSVLLKEKETILSLEFRNNSLDSSLLIWETILENKKKCLQELEEKLVILFQLNHIS